MFNNLKLNYSFHQFYNEVFELNEKSLYTKTFGTSYSLEDKIEKIEFSIGSFFNNNISFSIFESYTTKQNILSITFDSIKEKPNKDIFKLDLLRSLNHNKYNKIMLKMIEEENFIFDKKNLLLIKADIDFLCDIFSIELSIEKTFKEYFVVDSNINPRKNIKINIPFIFKKNNNKVNTVKEGIYLKYALTCEGFNIDLEKNILILKKYKEILKLKAVDLNHIENLALFIWDNIKCVEYNNNEELFEKMELSFSN